MKINAELCQDVSDKLKFDNPAFIEKDYYAVQLLKLIMQIQFEHWNIVFAGGTCLAKVHLKNLDRMSEDIDLKVLAKTSVNNLSNNQKIKLRKLRKQEIVDTIKKDKLFTVNEPKSYSRNERSNNVIVVEYPKDFKHPTLRPELKLKLTEVTQLWFNSVAKPISSIYAKEIGAMHICCVLG